MNCPEVIYHSRPGATPQAELSALCDAYHFLLLEKGDSHDLTNGLTAEMTKNGPQKTEREKT